MEVVQETDKAILKGRFRAIYGRNLGERAEQNVVNEGNPNCQHNRIFYVDNVFDGQAWWCDLSNCGRHERMDYSPGFKIRFPVNALISTPNLRYGGGNFYSFKTDEKGNVEDLHRDSWIEREVTRNHFS